jgi:peptide/nickel transport system substrate-binding protein
MDPHQNGTRRPTFAIGRRGLGQGAAALGLMGLLGPFPAMAQARRGGTLTVALPYDSDTLNPYATGFLGDVQATVLEGLIAPNEKTEYVPVLALQVPTVENGLIKLSEDGKRMTITYKLRPNVKWHDGQPFTSADVRFTWEAIKNPKFVGETKDGTQDIESIDTPDPLTAVVNYNTVTPTFPSALFSVGILPEHILKGQDLNSSPWADKPIGTGPFVVKDFRRGQYIIVERNPDYWRRDEAGNALPYLDRIIFKPMPDQNAMVTQLKAGEVQFAYTVPYPQAPQIAALPNMEIIQNRFLSWQYLAFNFRNEILRELPVRQAIAYAINKQAISRALGGYPFPVKSVVVPAFPYYDPDAPDHAFDAAKARAVLDAAGYVPGRDGVRAKGEKRLSFRIVCQAGLTADELAEQVMIANLKAIGVEAIPDNKGGVAFREARYKGGYDLLYARWLTSASPNYSVFYRSNGPNNGMGYNNPELDAVLDKVEHTMNDAERKTLFKEMQRIMGTDLPVVPITSNVNLIAVTKKLRNFVSNPTNRTNFIDTSKWYLES